MAKAVTANVIPQDHQTVDWTSALSHSISESQPSGQNSTNSTNRNPVSQSVRQNCYELRKFQ